MHRRTVTIEFKRQLWPQPPKKSSPYWCFINTLKFYKDGKEVWSQQIPEDSCYFQGMQNSKFNISGSSVEYNKDYGWILTFRMTHKEAFKIYQFLFEGHPDYKVEYVEDKGLQFRLKKQNEQEIFQSPDERRKQT